MQFKHDAKVYTFNGQHVGEIDRVVINPNTKEVTDIVVRKGFLLTQDKVVPLNLLTSATEDRVTLHENADDFDDLPSFEATHYVPLDAAEFHAAAYADELVTPIYWYPPLGLGYGYRPGYPYRKETDQNLPEGTIVLKEGARVVSVDQQHVGNVERIFTESEHNQATHFLISDGIIFKHKKLVPASWIRDMQEDELYLGVRAAMLDKLPEYQEVP